MSDKITKNGYVVDEKGLPRKIEDMSLADKVIAAKNKDDKWAVIDLLLRAWAERTPEEAQALKIQLEDQRETLADQEFGQTKGGADFNRRFTLVFPLQLMMMLRAVYSDEELTMDSKFYREFAKRYPSFRVAEKD